MVQLPVLTFSYAGELIRALVVEMGGEDEVVRHGGTPYAATAHQFWMNMICNLMRSRLQA
jgi:hypothetical protein